MVTQVGTTFLVGDTNGDHLTPPGSRGAGKSFSDDSMCGLHLDGRVGICEAGEGPGEHSGCMCQGLASQSHAGAMLQPHLLTPSFPTTQTH